MNFADILARIEESLTAGCYSSKQIGTWNRYYQEAQEFLGIEKPDTLYDGYVQNLQDLASFLRSVIGIEHGTENSVILRAVQMCLDSDTQQVTHSTQPNVSDKHEDPKVDIRGDIYTAKQVPTTQEDNYGGIIDRWNLFKNNIQVGKMVQWDCGTYRYVIGGETQICFDIDEVTFF